MRHVMSSNAYAFCMVGETRTATDPIRHAGAFRHTHVTLAEPKSLGFGGVRTAHPLLVRLGR
jgi:hypothetical protein